MSENRTDGPVSIKPAANGPYLVSNLPNLVGVTGNALATGETVALCRCGHSANKPFCDGSHKAQGFSGENRSDPDRDRRDDYVGKQITIHDNRSICAHAGLCTGGLPSVWRMGKEPWIDPDAGSVEAIMRVVESCPSGALSYTIAATHSGKTGGEPVVRVSKDGPYLVSGSVTLEGAHWAEGADPSRFALCRCGESRNKPFCDGSHWDAGFKDDGA